MRDQAEKKLEWAPRAGEKGKQEMVTPLGNWELVPPYLVGFEATASSTGERGGGRVRRGNTTPDLWDWGWDPRPPCVKSELQPFEPSPPGAGLFEDKLSDCPQEKEQRGYQ